jgi:hypothetical protein
MLTLIFLARKNSQLSDFNISQETSIKNDLVLNASYYKLSPNITKQMKDYVQRPKTYEEDPNKCLSLDCMSKKKQLFDLSWDIIESDDLSQRFRTTTDQLYETLRTYSNSSHPLVQPQRFDEWYDQSVTEDNVFTPWIS